MAGTASSHLMRHNDPLNHRGEVHGRSLRGAGAPEGKAAAFTPRGRKGNPRNGAHLFAAHGKPYPDITQCTNI